ncbi:MAG: M24 family metallopeptidase [Streptosporangiaceae bacterium]
MPKIHAARRAAAARRLAAIGADAALITDLVNVRYLTGLASSNAAVLLPADGPAVLATDSRYAGTAQRECPDLEIVVERAVEQVLAARAVAAGAATVAFEAQRMTVARHADLVASAGDRLRLVPIGTIIADLRAVKDESEIELVAAACAITGEAFTAVLDLIRPGVTERQIAVAIERAMVDLGAEAPAFDTIVASGRNGAVPHHVPGQREVRAGDLITIDCGARVGGYHADMTRTVAVGQVSDWQRDIYDLVARAQAAGIAALAVGAIAGDVDAASRDLIAGAGHAEHFEHGVGHGVGLEIHEAPWLAPGRAGRLQDRAVVTIEPGIYLPGMGGVRIEDTLAVRAGSGAVAPAEPLTTISRELLVL